MLKLKSDILFVGLGKTFQVWSPKNFEKFKNFARKKALQSRSTLNGITTTNYKREGDMSINIGGGELKELKPRILLWELVEQAVMQ